MAARWPPTNCQTTATSSAPPPRSAESDRGRALIAWYCKPVPGEFPADLRADGGAPTTLIVVRPNRTVWIYQREPYPIVLEGEQQAFGSGADAALAAMLCGKTAAEAVAIAAQVCANVGGGVDTLSFED